MATAVQSLTSKTEESMKCRIFIGNLPNEAVTKDLLKNIFSPYGSYVDCSIYKNYGFVQFNDEESAQKAVETLSGTVMFDRRLDIKIASAGKKDKNGTQSNAAGVGKTKRPIRPNLYTIQPLMSRPVYDPNFNYMARPPVQPNPYPYGATPMNMQGYGYPTGPVQPNSHSFPPMHPGQIKPLMQMNPSQPIGNPQPTANPQLTPQPPQPCFPAQPLPANPIDTSNSNKLCEIICTTRKQLSYAEFIESTLTRIGFACNINLLGVNYSPEIILNRISHDNYSIAISFKDENEANRSCNLHILFGAAEEHRNMPLHVAEQLLRKRFGLVSNAPIKPTQPVPNTPNPTLANPNANSQTAQLIPQRAPYSADPVSIANQVPSSQPAIDNKLNNKPTTVDNQIEMGNYSNAPMYTNTSYYGGYRVPTAQDPNYYQSANIYQNSNIPPAQIGGGYPPMPGYGMNILPGKRA